MPWTVYRWDDASAPAGVSSAAGTLITVLDACLINGYGAKASAGWSKVYSGTNKAVYRAPGGASRFYLRVDDSPTIAARWRGFEAMSDVDTGANPFPTDAQVSGGLYAYKSANSTARPWIVLADDKRVIVGVGDANTFGAPSSATGWQWFSFGDYLSTRGSDTYGAYCQGSTAASATTNTMALQGSAGGATNGWFTARLVSDVAGAATTTRVPAASMGANLTSGASSGYPYPDAATGGVIIAKMGLADVSPRTLRGFVPACWTICHSTSPNPFDTFSGAGVLAGRTFIVLPAFNASTAGRVAFETSDTVED